MFAVDPGLPGKAAEVHVVVALFEGPADQRAEMILAAERHPRGRVTLQAGKIDQVLGLHESQRQDVGSGGFRPATPIQRHRRSLHPAPSEFPRMVHVPYGRELLVQDRVVLVDQVGQRVADRDIGGLDADGADELPQECDDHLRRGVHVVRPPHQRVGFGIDVVVAIDQPDPVGFDDDFLALLVTHVPLAPDAIQRAEQGVPGLADGRLAGQVLDGPEHHVVHSILPGMVVVEPVSLTRPGPVGCLRIMDPDHAAGMNAPGLADGRKRLWLADRRARGQHAAESHGAPDCGDVLHEPPSVERLRREFRAGGWRRPVPVLVVLGIHGIALCGVNSPLIRAAGQIQTPLAYRALSLRTRA